MEPPDSHSQTTGPKARDDEGGFHDRLYDWMARTPWLAISAAVHLLAFFVLLAIPWERLRTSPERKIQATLEELPAQVFEEQEELLEQEAAAAEEQGIEEPILKDAEIADHDEPAAEEDHGAAAGDPDFPSSRPFEESGLNDVIGIGGGASGKFGERFGTRQDLRAAGGSGTEQALKEGLEWLREHQSANGSWDCDGFASECGKIGSTSCDGPGNAAHDVGVTGLALLAFLGDGHTTSEGAYREVVTRGVKWLRDQQDPELGLIGKPSSRDFIYDHALATLAICETYYFSKSPLIRRVAQDAVDYIVEARNPYGAWRYDVPPIGDNDTSITGWMVFALTSAKEAGLKVDPAAFQGALAWIDEVSDPATGRVGYDSFGSLSSRTSSNEHFPREKGEALTAVGLLCRIFLGQDPGEHEIMRKHAELLRRVPPLWDPEGFGCDMYYWYYGTYAMYQMGGNYWTAWNSEMKRAVLESQERDGDQKGSWDPVGPWGFAGGRVYSTALMTLCLEVYFRYAKVLGGR